MLSIRTMDHLEQIRGKLSIEEVVGWYLQLQKAGRNLKGLCPFHNDSHPSFMVSPEKGIGYCFSCNNGGDIFKFIQLIEGVEFPEAVRILADKSGVTLPAFNPKQRDNRMKTIEINQSAVKFFKEQLDSSDRHTKYFTDRGLTKETIDQFKLGLAPDSFHALRENLLKRGYKEEDLLLSGIINQRSIADKQTYDRFRNRMIFPIFDHQDNPVAFGGRIITDGEPKYLNSPDTPAYNKSLILYGLNWAKESVKKNDSAIFVEGYMDVITAHQAGFKNVVATSGTALTPLQLKLIKRYTKNVSFAFDRDSAGMEATKRAVELAQGGDLKIKIITIPEGKDPDDCIKKSPEEWEKAVNNAVPVMDFYFNYADNQFDKTSMDGKKQIMNMILPLIKQYSTEVEQNEFLKKLALMLQTDVELLWNDIKNVPKNKPITAEVSTKPDQRIFSREEFLIGFLLEKPQFYPLVQEGLINSIPFDPKTERFYNTFKKVYNLSGALDISEVKKELSEDANELDVYSMLIEKFYPDFSDRAIELEINQFIRLINKGNLEQAEKTLLFKIRSNTNPEDGKLLLNQQIQISKLKTKIL